MPNSNEAKYALIKSDLRSFDTDSETNNSSILNIINSMTGSARAVAEAIIAFSAGDIQTVANLDQQLSQAQPEESWFSEAVKLRVDWRNSVSNPDLQQQFADQAWQILDLAMANENDHDFLAMRIVSAAQAQRKTEVIESTRHYIASLEAQLIAIESDFLNPSKQELDLKANQIEVIKRLFSDAHQQDQASNTDAQSISSNLDELLLRFQRETNSAS